MKVRVWLLPNVQMHPRLQYSPQSMPSPISISALQDFADPVSLAVGDIPEFNHGSPQSLRRRPSAMPDSAKDTAQRLPIDITLDVIAVPNNVDLLKRPRIYNENVTDPVVNHYRCFRRVL